MTPYWLLASWLLFMGALFWLVITAESIDETVPHVRNCTTCAHGHAWTQVCVDCIDTDMSKWVPRV